MASIYTLIPDSTLNIGTINTWTDGTIIINNGSSVKLDLSQLKYNLDGFISDIRIIKVEVTWPTSEVTSYYTKLMANDTDSWLKTIGPKHIVFEEPALVNNNKLKQINIMISLITDINYKFQFL